MGTQTASASASAEVIGRLSTDVVDGRPRVLRNGRPVVLRTATEHYGAILNGAFDYVAYLSMLAASGSCNRRAKPRVITYASPAAAKNTSDGSPKPAPPFRAGARPKRRRLRHRGNICSVGYG